jgi:soluble lytic murein transglycosylase-like protein
MKLLFALSMAGVAAAQTLPADAIRVAMEPSLEQQRESVRRQVQLSESAKPEWFTVSWPLAGAPPLKPVRAMVAPFGAAVCDPVPEPELDTWAEQAASGAGVSADLVRAVARQESGYRPCAVSPKGAKGLMQLMPDTIAQFDVSDPFDPQQSISGGAKLLAQLLKRYEGDLRLVLSAYNAGTEAVDRYGGIPPFPETQNYVAQILSHLSVGSNQVRQ